MMSQFSLAPEHFVGPVLESQFATVTVLSRLQEATMGLGICKGSFAVMVRHNPENNTVEPGMSPSGAPMMCQDFVLLRLLDILPLPESNTRLGKRCDQLMANAIAGPGSEADHCLIRYAVLGAYVADDVTGTIRFSGDPGHLSASGQCLVFSPSALIMEILANGVLNPTQRIQFGHLRTSETLAAASLQQAAYLCMLDIRGKRTAVLARPGWENQTP